MNDEAYGSEKGVGIMNKWNNQGRLPGKKGQERPGPSKSQE
jgi:hypothetical protein